MAKDRPEGRGARLNTGTRSVPERAKSAGRRLILQHEALVLGPEERFHVLSYHVLRSGN